MLCTHDSHFCGLNGAVTGLDNEKVRVTQTYILYCLQCKSSEITVRNNMYNIHLLNLCLPGLNGAGTSPDK